MYQAIRLGLIITISVVLSVGGSIFIFLNYVQQPIVVIDLKELVAYEQDKTKAMDNEKRIEEVGNFFDKLSKDVKGRKEIVLVKEAVVNAEQLKDITNEFKR